MSLFAISHADQSRRPLFPSDVSKQPLEGYSRLGVSWDDINRQKQPRKDSEQLFHSVDTSPDPPKQKTFAVQAQESFLANPVSEWETRHKLMEAEYKTYLQNSYKNRPKSRTPDPPPAANKAIGRRNREGEVERRRKEVLQEPHDPIYFPFGRPGGGAPLRDPKSRLLGPTFAEPVQQAEPERGARTVEVSPTRITSYMTPGELERKSRMQGEMKKLLDEQIEERKWRIDEEKRGRLLEEQLEEERLARQRQELEEEYRRELLSREGYSQSPPPPAAQSEKLPSKPFHPPPKPEPHSQTDPPVRRTKAYEPSKYVAKPFLNDDRVQRLRDDMAGRQQNLQELIMRLKEESQGLAMQKLDALREFDQLRDSINTRSQQAEHYQRQGRLVSQYHSGPWREPFHPRVHQESRFFPMAKAGQSIISGLAPAPSFKTMPAGSSREYTGVDSPDIKIQLNKLDSILDYCRGVGDMPIGSPEPLGRPTIDELREAEKDMDERVLGGSQARVDVEESAKFPEEAAAQVLPGNPNSQECVTIGAFDGVLYLAFGAGNNVVLTIAHTFSFLQLLQEHKDPVTAVVWARSGGRLASASANLVVVSIPAPQQGNKPHEWHPALTIKPVGNVESLSWSFRADLLSTAGTHLALWYFETTSTGLLQYDTQPFWTQRTPYSAAKVSPDGRLVASLNQKHFPVIWTRVGQLNTDGSFPRLNPDAMEAIHLDARDPVVFFDWKSMPIYTLYLTKYNPNVLLVVTSKGQVRVYSEFYSPKGIGFNVVFQRQESSLQASWLRSFENLENQTVLVAQKQDHLRKQHGTAEFSIKAYSSLVQTYRSEPEITSYGFISKDHGRVEWFLTFIGQQVDIYICEGLGGFPPRAVAVKPYMHYDQYYSPEALRWIPKLYPLHVIREEEEVIIIGRDIMGDFVRWRKHFEKVEYGGYSSSLTAVSGGHRAAIIQVEPHSTLPVLATLDSTGLVRFWNASMSMTGDQRAIDVLRHWGALESTDISSIKWCKSFALPISCSFSGRITVWQWSSDSANKLKLPSMLWKEGFTWDTRKNIGKMETGMVRLKGGTNFVFEVAGLGPDLTVWRVNYQNKAFMAKEVLNRPGEYVNLAIISIDTDKDAPNYDIVLLSKRRISRLTETGELWCVEFEVDCSNFQLSGIIAVCTHHGLTFIGLDGVSLGSLGSKHEGESISSFISREQVTESLALVQGTKLTVYAQRYLKEVGEQALSWERVVQIDLDFTVACLAQTLFFQLVLSSEATLMIFSPEVEHGNFFHFLASFQEPLPLYSPTYLLEFIRLNEYSVVEKILKALNSALERGRVSRTLKLNFSDLFEVAPKTTAAAPKAAPAAASDMDWFFDSSPAAVPTPAPAASSTGVGLPQSDAKELKERVLDLSNELPSVSGDFTQLRMLEELVNCCVRIGEQGRTLDDFAIVYSVHVSLLRLQPDFETQALNTMEVAWALHSDQQDTLFQLCFPGELTWGEMRQYGMGLWVQSLSRLKTMVEVIARTTYRQTKDPKSVLLWYLALNKKAILLGLFKADRESEKIYQFMNNDFSQERWQVAAQKNAFELRKQRKYEMCAGFFLLANKLTNAAEIIARDIGDIQLALTVCRLIEGSDRGPAFTSIVTKFVLNAGVEAQDPWITSIGHTWLHQHTESLECLSVVPDSKTTLKTELWAENCQPQLTGFHPCVVTFVRLLKSTVKVKRDAQDKGVALVKHDNILKGISARSAKAYMRTGLPLLSLFILSQVANEDVTALGDACCVHLQAVVADTAEMEWKQELPTLCSVITDMTTRFHLPASYLNDYIAQIFHKRGLSHYHSSFLSGLKLPVKSSEIVLNRAAIVHIILSRVSRDTKFICKPGTLKSLTTELIQCLSLLWPTSKSLSSLPVSERSNLLAIVLSIYLSAMMSGYMRNQWRETAQVLKSLEEQLAEQSFPFYTSIELSTNDTEDSGDLLFCWFKYLLVKRLTTLMASFNFKPIDDYFDEGLNDFNLLERAPQKGKVDKPMNVVQRALGPGRGRKKRPLMPVSRLLRRVESWGRRLAMRINKLISNMTIEGTQNVLKLFTKRHEEFPEGLAAHFKSQADYDYFSDVVNAKAELHYLLIASSKSISNFIYENAGKVAVSIDKEGFIYEESVRENADLFGSGVELYHGKEPILGFAINRCDKKSLILACEASKSKGLREINIENSLKYEKRTDKFMLSEEEPASSSDPDSYMFNQTIMAALGSLYDAKKRVFEEKVKLPPNRWHGIELDNLVSQLSGHKDYNEHVRTICGHPLLPLFVTGNKSGVLTLWHYDRANSLNDFATANSRAMIKFLDFNEYGDKMGACDAQGNFFLYRFDLQATSFHPQLSLMASMGNQTRSFAFLNLGSIVATIGHKPRAFMSIYDTLLPPRSSLLHSDNVGGCTVNYLSKYQQLLIGGKKGKLVVYDMRKQEVVTTLETGQGSLKGVCTDASELTFATGGLGSGIVKIWDSRTLQLRDSVEVVKGKAGISSLKFMDTSLFSSTSDGSFKLLRTTTH